MLSCKFFCLINMKIRQLTDPDDKDLDVAHDSHFTRIPQGFGEVRVALVDHENGLALSRVTSPLLRTERYLRNRSK